jgi:hypothetical protein
MITPKIKALFQFIEYLHSNIDNFKQYDEVINEFHLLVKERNQLKPRHNFKDKLKFDEVQAEIEVKFKVIQENILQPIRTKATELNICDLNKTETVWNWNSTEIHQLKENFSKDDLPEIFSHKSKYIEYREKTKGEAFFGLWFFFDDLDEILKELFDYFKEAEHNEFETFETKAIQVNDIGEAVKLFQSGKFSKFTLPNSFLNPSTIQQHTNIEPLPPQPIDEQKPIKYGAKEYALTYIFDLYATGKQVPINRIEGSLDAKKIKQDVSKFPMYDKAPDTFYRAVKSVLEYDLNKPTDLQNISKDWLNAVRNLSTNWVITERYLKDKNLIGE